MARPDQTEKATPKKRSDARKRGQIARSLDLSSAVTFLVIIAMLHMLFLPVLNGTGATMRSAIQHLASRETFTAQSAGRLFLLWAMAALLPLCLLFGTAMLAGVLANVLQVGVNISAYPLKPNFSRVNPLQGIKRLFSAQILVNLAKQVAKLSAVALLFYQSLHGDLDRIFGLADVAPFTMISFVENKLFAIGLRFGFFLLAVGLFDFLWERRRLSDSLKMTKSEVKDEHRQQEGSSEAKSVFRRRQRELSRRRMMSAVPKATVIITNPTHFAVALRWDELKMAAPVVVAKGADLLAKRIRDVAREHEVPIIENPPLARTLYASVPLDTPIPPDMYAAVAKIIAFIFALKTRPTSGGLASLVMPPVEL